MLELTNSCNAVSFTFVVAPVSTMAVRKHPQFQSIKLICILIVCANYCIYLLNQNWPASFRNNSFLNAAAIWCCPGIDFFWWDSGSPSTGGRFLAVLNVSNGAIGIEAKLQRHSNGSVLHHLLICGYSVQVTGNDHQQAISSSCRNTLFQYFLSFLATQSWSWVSMLTSLMTNRSANWILWYIC